MTRHELLSFFEGLHRETGGWPDRPQLVHMVKINRRYFGGTWDSQLRTVLRGCLTVGYLAEMGCEHCGAKRIELTDLGRVALADMNQRGCDAHWLNKIHGRSTCQTEFEFSGKAA